MIPHRFASACLVAAGCALLATARAATTDLATAPLVTSSSQDVLPNLMFILDDSGSMAWTHMPDTVETFAVNKYGYTSPQCNGIYYNPSVDYKVPVASDGTKYAAAIFTAAKRNGFDTSASPSTSNLATSFQPYTSATTDDNLAAPTGAAAYYYKYTGTQTSSAQRDYLNTSGSFYTECNSAVGTAPGNAVFTKVVVSAASGPTGIDERVNFANWFSYYRTRMLLMKTQTGRAFQGVGDRYRVGYMSINNNTAPSFLNVGTFGATQKATWFSKLYGATASGSTPLRAALSNAGRIYANKLGSLYSTTVTDPMQYSCQKNFTLLSTDGYWNSGAGFQLDGSTAVGQQDGDDPRPYNDGTTSVTIRVATITFSGTSSSTLVTSVKVAGAELMSGSIDDNNDPNKVAQRVRDKINDCTGGLSGNCSVAGYSAVRAGRVVTITAPASAGPLSSSPAVTKGYGSMGVAVTAFGASTSTIAGPGDTLADVAAYYYKTDLRSTALNNTMGAPDKNNVTHNVAKDNVVGNGDDDVAWQHMTTYTLGLGARGRMTYDLKYKVGGMSADYDAIVAGSAATSSVCAWQAVGTACNWPTPGSDKPENIDDMWHAAVNGRGLYFSAGDSASLSVSLSAALQSIAAVDSDTSAATVSNPSIKSGDNFIFISTFRSETWTGQLERRTVDTDNANETSVTWKAHELLDVKAPATRNIHTYDPTSASTRLKPFLWASLSGTEQVWFGKDYISSSAPYPLNQFCAVGNICLSPANQTAAAGEALVNFLRGDRSNEGVAIDTDKYFRLRLGVLGDIVSSETAYVGVPTRDYVDAGYAAFKQSNATRAKMVYVGANDGMLHAFDFATGQESWAYVPSFVLPKMYRLADKYYGGSHQPLVDATPATTDVKIGGAWKTILVGGLGLGGRGYYALDITDPASPKALWEFSDDNMGYSFGRPEITKLKDGTWVVLLSSGYNNVSPGDGQGRLFVVDAGTGALIRSIATGVGSTGTPSGMTAIAAWVENNRYDNTALRVYGGDLEGNLWRFDINGDIGVSGYEAHRLAELRGSDNKAQPLTARPELGKVKGYPIVFVGTGRYLHATDLSDTSGQTIYGIKDDLVNNTSHGNPRTAGGFVQQTLTATTCAANSKFCTTGAQIRTASTNAVDFDTNKGWYVDLPISGERANTDPQLALGTLAISTNIPSSTACEPGGTSFTNFLDYRTGGAVPTSEGVAGVALDGIASRAEIVQTSTDPSKPKLYDKVSTSKKVIETTPLPFDPQGTGTRRTSWRQLVVD